MSKRFWRIVAAASFGAAPRDGSFELAAQPADYAGWICTANGAIRETYRVREPGRCTAAWRLSKGKTSKVAPPENPPKPVARGGRGDLVGSYPGTDILFFGAYYKRTF